MGIAFGMAARLTFIQSAEAASFADFLSLRVKIQNFVIFLGILIVWHWVFSYFRLYNSRRLSTLQHEIYDVIKATSIGILIFTGTAILFKIKMATPDFLVAFCALAIGTTVASRILLRYALSQLRFSGRNLRHILIVGTNPRAIRFAQKIESKPEIGYRLLGFADDVWDKIHDFQKTGYALVSSLKELPSFIRNNVVDEVTVCLPMKSFYQQSSQIFSFCSQQGVHVSFHMDIFEGNGGETTFHELGGHSIMTLSNGAIKGWPVFAKRVIDLVVSLCMLIILSPLFAAVAILIKWDSPGPVFFMQDRVGLGKRRFRLCKFRSMVADAEKRMKELEHLNEVSGPVFKIKEDPRITRTGKFLRKTSIDELPQLINVLKGDMSLVGPRPLPVRDYNGFDQDWQRRRLSVRPGITCLWQVNGRSDINFDKWMRLDMEYIDNWSLWLDFMILLKTFPAVLRGSGAA